MTSINLQLLRRLNVVGCDAVASVVRRCIREGVTGKDELAHISATVLQHLPNLGANDIVSILSSLSKAHYRNFHLFSALVERLEQLPPLPLRESCSILRFFSRFHFTNTALVMRCTDVINKNLDKLRPSDICEVLHSLTKLRYCNDELIQALVAKGLENLATFDDLLLVNFVTGCSKANVSDTTVDALCHELRSRAGTLGPLEVLRSLLALSRFKSHPDAKIAAQSVIKGLNCSRFTLLQLTLALEAINALGCDGRDRVKRALELKRDAYPIVPPELVPRIEAAMAAEPAEQGDASTDVSV